MNKSDVVQALRADGFSDAEGAVDRVLEVIALSLACGETVTIRRFGKFEPRNRAAVVRKNPKTGDDVHVPAKVHVGFVPATALKERINSGR